MGEGGHGVCHEKRLLRGVVVKKVREIKNIRYELSGFKDTFQLKLKSTGVKYAALQNEKCWTVFYGCPHSILIPIKDLPEHSTRGTSIKCRKKNNNNLKKNPDG